MTRMYGQAGDSDIRGDKRVTRILVAGLGPVRVPGAAARGLERLWQVRDSDRTRIYCVTEAGRPIMLQETAASL